MTANARVERPLSLRPPRAEDAQPLLDAIRESMTELSTWMSWCHAGYGLEDSAQWIARTLAAGGGGGGGGVGGVGAVGAVGVVAPPEHNFVILDAGSRILGTCGLNQIRPENRLANLGYWVRTSAAGNGVATEAVGRIAEYAFARTDLARLEIVVAVDNAGSRRVAEKAGAIFEGVARDRIFIHGAHTDAAMYVLLRSERRAPA